MIEKDALAIIPTSSGCYLFKNEEGHIIYVGKAKDLKKRVNSYFNRPHEGKTSKLVIDAKSVSFITTPSEKEALLLEIDLIKQHRPVYNIMFMDDKTYPMIKLTHETFPQLLVVRDRKKDKKAMYFGPYPDARAARDTLKLLHDVFPLRKCRTLPKQVCLYYHIKQCSGPCQAFIKPNEYQSIVEDVKKVLKGDWNYLFTKLQADMMQASDRFQFELAATLRDRLASAHYVAKRQSITNFESEHDVVGYATAEGILSLSFFMIREGKIVKKDDWINDLMQPMEDQVETLIQEYYMSSSKPKLLMIPSGLNATLLSETLNIKVTSPLRGDKVKEIQWAIDNANQSLRYHLNREKQKGIDVQEACETLAMHLESPPIDSIEMVDVSHTFGTHTVGARIVFEQGAFNKAKYRRYKLHAENNDLENMREMLYRRLYRALEGSEPLPDLMLVDGGLTQLHVLQSLLQEMNLSCTVAGLVKDQKHQTSDLIRVDGVKIPLLALDPLTLLCVKLQDEVHRFAITFHKQLRSKAQTHSQMLDIPGLGQARINALMKRFKSISGLKNASFEALSEVVPANVAHNIITHFKGD
jgi:excinuclease ABC subunit C